MPRVDPTRATKNRLLPSPERNGHVRLNGQIERTEVVDVVATEDFPRNLKAFRFHGMQLTLPGEGGTQAKGDCPFCGREGKFCVAIETGLFDCKLCGISGNPLTFLRQLQERSFTATNDWEELRVNRKLLEVETLIHWGACRSIINGDWLMPAHNPEMKLWQLCRRHQLRDRHGEWHWNLSPSPGVHADGASHGLFGVPLFDRRVKQTLITEGVWDGMVLWEALKAAGRKVNVLAVPGANVFKPEWAAMLKDHEVTLLHDNDHPQVHPLTGELQPPVGWAGMRRTSRLLLSSAEPPASISFMCWASANGGNAERNHNPDLPHGFDVRDHLGQGTTPVERLRLADELLALCQPIPDAWRENIAVKGQSVQLTAEPCERWSVLLASWEKAFAMRRSLEDVLSIMLALSASTLQQGDQLFLQVIGSAGSGKTKMCEGFVVSKNCKLLLQLTGFHSGYNDGSGKEFSFVDRVNGKCMVTPEGDVLMSSDNYDKLMSEIRQIFDGRTGATYKNSDADKEWAGLRTPWIMAGTQALLDKDQSRLGDRFLKVFIDDPTEDEADDICMQTGLAALRAVRKTSNCDPNSTVDGVMLDAQRLTGGYVDWLRANVAEEIDKLRFDERALVAECRELAKFVAAMRARPAIGFKHRDKLDHHDTKELPSRLTHQFVRLACCLAVVLNRSSIDAEVMRRIKKVALDTAAGVSLKIVMALAEAGGDGADINDLQIVSNLPPEKLGPVLGFLTNPRVGVLEQFEDAPGGRGWKGLTKWRLTERMAQLRGKVFGDELQFGRGD